METIHPQRPRLDAPVLDMTPDGQFREPPRGGPFDRLLARVGGTAAAVTALVAVLALGALAVVALTVLVPLLIGAGAVAFGTLWWRAKRAAARR